MASPGLRQREESGGRLGQILSEAGLLTPAQLRSALAAQRDSGRLLGRTLVDLGIIDEETLVGALARQLRLPVADLRGLRVDPQLLELVPAALAHELRCLPLYMESRGTSRFLHLALEDPGDEVTLAELRTRLGLGLRPVLAAPSALEAALLRNYGPLPGRAGAEDGSPPSRREKPRVEAEELARALAQLLVEKGLIGRGELAARLESLARKG